MDNAPVSRWHQDRHAPRLERSHTQAMAKGMGQRPTTHDAWDKNPRSGGKKVGQFVLTQRPYRERMADFPESDLVAEGGLWATVEEYQTLQGGDPEKVMVVIRFCKLPGVQRRAGNPGIL
jgi:hypothetical protein